MRISDWSSDVCSSDLPAARSAGGGGAGGPAWQRGRGSAGVDRPGRRAHPACGGSSSLRPDRAGTIGRASCRERVCQYLSLSVVAVSLKKNKPTYERTIFSRLEQSITETCDEKL